MNSPAVTQTIGNICIGLAGLVFLGPLQVLLSNYAHKHVNDDQWVTPALRSLIPLWLLLLGALLCQAATGGFHWLPLGRPVLYALTVAATLALGVVSFVSVALFIRPGFTPRHLYYPVIWLVPLSTMLVGVLSLNPRLAEGLPVQWLRVPWALLAAVSLIGCGIFFGQRLVRTGLGGVMGIAHRIAHPGPSTQETVAQITAMDPEIEFESLLWRTNRQVSREVRDAATARLRAHPQFLHCLCTKLESGHVEPAVTFLRDNPLSPAELTRLAMPARKAMERWVDRIPPANCTTKKHLRDCQRWGTEVFRVLSEKFTGTGVDFAPVMDEFKDKVEPKK